MVETKNNNEETFEKTGNQTNTKLTFTKNKTILTKFSKMWNFTAKQTTPEEHGAAKAIQKLGRFKCRTTNTCMDRHSNRAIAHPVPQPPTFPSPHWLHSYGGRQRLKELQSYSRLIGSPPYGRSVRACMCASRLNQQSSQTRRARNNSFVEAAFR